MLIGTHIRTHTYCDVPHTTITVCASCMSSARVDGLAKRELTATEMTEHFENRADFLYHRHVTYSKPTKKFEPAEKAKKKSIMVSKYFFK